jgi:hypothetical protein
MIIDTYETQPGHFAPAVSLIGFIDGEVKAWRERNAQYLWQPPRPAVRELGYTEMLMKVVTAENAGFYGLRPCLLRRINEVRE